MMTLHEVGEDIIMLHFLATNVDFFIMFAFLIGYITLMFLTLKKLKPIQTEEGGKIPMCKEKSASIVFLAW